MVSEEMLISNAICCTDGKETQCKVASFFLNYGMMQRSRLRGFIFIS